MNGSCETRDRRRVGQVEREIFDDQPLCRTFRDGRLPACLVDISDKNPCALASQQKGSGLADPGSAAGDNDAFAL
jgi:hypothetical protein